MQQQTEKPGLEEPRFRAEARRKFFYKMVAGSGNACNPWGLIHSLGEATDLAREEKCSFQEMKEHPAIRVLLYQIVFLTYGREPWELSDDYVRAIEECERRSE